MPRFIEALMQGAVPGGVEGGMRGRFRTGPADAILHPLVNHQMPVCTCRSYPHTQHEEVIT